MSVSQVGARSHDGVTLTAIQDPHRPSFHFTSPVGWLNDPNGLCQWDGVYHLFYQYNPDGPVHADIHWGHATSTDLVHWIDAPVALAPSTGADSQGCWSGVIVDDAGTPTIIYSGHNPDAGRTQTCCIATGNADLTAWGKDPNNPVIPGPPPGHDVTEFRDHSLWKDAAGKWHQVMGSGIRGEGGVLFHYSSPDLRAWTFEGTYLTGRDIEPGGAYPGTTWECPDLFTLPTQGAGTDVLVFSAWDEGITLHPVYITGQRGAQNFIPNTQVRHLDYGLRHFYAPQSFTADDGRRIQFGWAQEARPQDAILAAGWSGVMSLPRHLTLNDAGHLIAAPVAETDALRIGAGEAVPAIGPGERVRATTVGDQLDIIARGILAPGGELAIYVRTSSDHAESTVITVAQTADGGEAVLRLDRRNSRSDLDAGSGYDTVELGGPIDISDNGEVDLRVLVDHSMLEIFANGQPLTARVYPSRHDATGVELTVSGEGSLLTEITVWQMAQAEQAERVR